MTNSALVYESKCSGGGVGCGVSANYHSCTHGAQINFWKSKPKISIQLKVRVYGGFPVILCFKRPNLNDRFPRGVAKKPSLSYVTFYPLEDLFAKTKASITLFTELDII
jgi:hypothetical protein